MKKIYGLRALSGNKADCNHQFTIHEYEYYIYIPEHYKGVFLSPDEARYIAERLADLAGEIDLRRKDSSD